MSKCIAYQVVFPAKGSVRHFMSMIDPLAQDPQLQRLSENTALCYKLPAAARENIQFITVANPQLPSGIADSHTV